ncbi:MAG: NADH-quinone oxidoreductase subunit NuoE [Candidatus Coatesbacteria bacterium]|nr:NADH-quinone oxidoreductase subunit NuoE [Candidatus Coatesbacteria bacterium]
MDNEVYIIEEILSRFPADPEAVIPILQDLQASLRYIPEEAVILIAERLNIPAAKVYSIATFYNAFSLKPKGKHLIHVCLGTACHVKGANDLLEKFKRELEIEEGETSSDGEFTLEAVRCIGCCSLAPVIRVDEETFGTLKQERIPSILEKYRAKSEGQEC